MRRSSHRVQRHAGRGKQDEETEWFIEWLPQASNDPRHSRQQPLWRALHGRFRASIPLQRVRVGMLAGKPFGPLGGNTVNTTDFGHLGPGESFGYSSKGPVGGGQAGCNRQIDQWVVGVEGTLVDCRPRIRPPESAIGEP